jgi:hypothetical protein
VTDILLVHGAWDGPWCWDGFAARLGGHGHQVQADCDDMVSSRRRADHRLVVTAIGPGPRPGRCGGGRWPPARPGCREPFDLVGGPAGAQLVGGLVGPDGDDHDGLVAELGRLQLPFQPGQQPLGGVVGDAQVEHGMVREADLARWEGGLPVEAAGSRWVQPPSASTTPWVMLSPKHRIDATGYSPVGAVGLVPVPVAGNRAAIQAAQAGWTLAASSARPWPYHQALRPRRPPWPRTTTSTRPGPGRSARSSSPRP